MQHDRCPRYPSPKPPPPCGAGDLTSTDLTEAVLARADVHDGALGTYLARFDEHALAAAALADSELAEGIDRGPPRRASPLGIKDIIAAAEGPTTGNSLVLDPGVGSGQGRPGSGPCLRSAGAVITGKLTTMEFACGAPDPAKPFPLPRNPWNTDTWPGGSSSGTGAGVAAGFFLGGLGTDTGGSIRLPSAFCGITGLMPTFGRVPKSGCAPLGYSLDHIGPMARTSEDCAAMLQVLAGYHASDPDCADLAVPDFSAGLVPGSLEGKRIGVDRVHHFPEGADPAVAPSFEAAAAVLEGLGATVVEVVLPLYEEMLAADMVTMGGEALAYHLPDMRTRWEDFFLGTRRMVVQGALLSGADFVQAQRVRRVALKAPSAPCSRRWTWWPRATASMRPPHYERSWRVVCSTSGRCSSTCTRPTGTPWAIRRWSCPWASPPKDCPCRFNSPHPISTRPPCCRPGTPSNR